MSRLFGGGVSRCADSVLIAAVDRDTCEADLDLRVSCGSKVAATQPRRRGGLDGRRASGFGGRRVAERADARRSWKARAPIPRGEFGPCDPRCRTVRPAHRCAFYEATLCQAPTFLSCSNRLPPERALTSRSPRRRRASASECARQHSRPTLAVHLGSRNSRPPSIRGDSCHTPAAIMRWTCVRAAPSDRRFREEPRRTTSSSHQWGHAPTAAQRSLTS